MNLTFLGGSLDQSILSSTKTSFTQNHLFILYIAQECSNSSQIIQYILARQFQVEPKRIFQQLNSQSYKKKQNMFKDQFSMMIKYLKFQSNLERRMVLKNRFDMNQVIIIVNLLSSVIHKKKKDVNVKLLQLQLQSAHDEELIKLFHPQISYDWLSFLIWVILKIDRSSVYQLSKLLQIRQEKINEYFQKRQNALAYKRNQDTNRFRDLKTYSVMRPENIDILLCPLHKQLLDMASRKYHGQVIRPYQDKQNRIDLLLKRINTSQATKKTIKFCKLLQQKNMALKCLKDQRDLKLNQSGLQNKILDQKCQYSQTFEIKDDSRDSINQKIIDWDEIHPLTNSAENIIKDASHTIRTNNIKDEKIILDDGVKHKVLEDPNFNSTPDITPKVTQTINQQIAQQKNNSQTMHRKSYKKKIVHKTKQKLNLSKLIQHQKQITRHLKSYHCKCCVKKIKQQSYSYEDQAILYLLFRLYGIKGIQSLLAQKILNKNRQELISYFIQKNVSSRAQSLQFFINTRIQSFIQFPQLLKYQKNEYLITLTHQLSRKIYKTKEEPILCQLDEPSLLKQNDYMQENSFQTTYGETEI